MKLDQRDPCHRALVDAPYQFHQLPADDLSDLGGGTRDEAELGRYLVHINFTSIDCEAEPN
jgi:hypothetical protein